MKTHFYLQLLFSLIITAALGAVTYSEWKKQEFWGFVDPEAKDMQAKFKAKLLDFQKSVLAGEKSFGDWEFVGESKMDAKEIQVAGVDVALSWNFTNSKLNEHVNIFLASGPTNQIAIHTPDQCYPGHGKNQDSENFVTQIKVDKGSWGDFRYQTFTSQQNDVKNFHEIWWGFNDGKRSAWHGPVEARQQFPNQAGLYKLYVSRTVLEAGRAKSVENAPQMVFLRAFLPVLNETLYPEKDKKVEPGEGEDNAAPIAGEKPAVTLPAAPAPGIPAAAPQTPAAAAPTAVPPAEVK